ncbi:hypothetical protein KAR91_66840 [Candidatus Pacearchaeota archaeon]|nr:hypothetical protein [Candidatus Pacearchaeota archaeon]
MSFDYIAGIDMFVCEGCGKEAKFHPGPGDHICPHQRDGEEMFEESAEVTPEQIKFLEDRIEKKEGMDKSKSGAVRNKLKGFRFDLLVFEFLCEMAEVMAGGVETHGEDNWKSGFDNPGRDMDNHIFGHYRKWKAGDRSEPHLAKMAIGCMFLWWFDQKTPQINSQDV